MDLENEDFRLFAEHAERCELKYMVIGGFAMYLDGLSRQRKVLMFGLNQHMKMAIT